MTKNILVIFAVIVLVVNLAYAVDKEAEVSDSPAVVFQDPSTGMELIFVKGGCFTMGDIYGDGEPEERPVHEVCVDDFYIGKYEVTQEQWRSVMGDNPSEFKDCGDNCPVENVSWDDAREFINKLNSRSGGDKYRLPTEAEWEYATRSGGKNERYSGGNDMESVAWYDMNAENVIHPVGAKAPNGLGLYDMSGNVWEWVNDWYAKDYYEVSPRNNPKGPDSGKFRVGRGGCATGPYANMRVSRREAYEPDTHHLFLGFRIAMVP